MHAMLQRQNPALAPMLALGSLLLGLGCGGDRITGDRVNTVNQALVITPKSPGVVAGQSIQFQSTIPWSGGATLWSVVPTSAGTITASGLFTAATSEVPGQALTVLAVWSHDVRYTASTDVSVLAPPAPAESSPDYVATNGVQQTVPGSEISNGAMVGEIVPVTVSTSASGLIQNRGDFLPPSPTTSH
jgi:hypothetical protein